MRDKLYTIAATVLLLGAMTVVTLCFFGSLQLCR